MKKLLAMFLVLLQNSSFIINSAVIFPKHSEQAKLAKLREKFKEKYISEKLNASNFIDEILADPRTTAENVAQALINASILGNAINIAKILASEHSQKIPDDIIGLALFNAIENKHPHIAQLLLKEQRVKNIIPTQPRYLELALIQASRYNFIDIVKILLDIGIDIDAKSDIAATPLYVAAYQGHTDIVRLLLDKGANINQARTTDGATPLYVASQNGHTDVVRLLLDKGANINQALTTGATPLYIAAYQGHTDVVRLLLDKGTNINQARTTGATPLFIAAQKGHADIVRLLLDKGANINQALTDGATPLYVASQNGHTDIVRLLLDKGAHINQARTTGATPLFAAAYHGHADIVRLLLDKGANTDLKVDNKTALDIAQERLTEALRGNNDQVAERYKLIVRLFKTYDKAHAALRNDAKEKYGNHPLYLAYEKFLKGSDLELRNLIFGQFSKVMEYTRDVTKTAVSVRQIHNLKHVAQALSEIFKFENIAFLLLYLSNNDDEKQLSKIIFNTIVEQLLTKYQIQIDNDSRCIICFQEYKDLQEKKINLIPMACCKANVCTSCYVETIDTVISKACPYCRKHLQTKLDENLIASPAKSSV